MTPQPVRPAGRKVAPAAMLVAGAALLAGSITLAVVDGSAAAQRLDAGTVPGVGPAVPGPDGEGSDGLPAAAAPWVSNPRLAAPERLQAPAVGVDARVVAIATDPDGALRVPEDGSLVGWWAAGPRPGSSTGTTVLTGHVDTWDAGAGALFRVRQLRPGELVEVATADRRWSYRVAAIRQYRKTALPVEVFAAYGQPRLVLVTCGGAFDERTHRYEDNVVVYAVPV